MNSVVDKHEARPAATSRASPGLAGCAQAHPARVVELVEGTGETGGDR
jgi:hypothetical protein